MINVQDKIGTTRSYPEDAGASTFLIGPAAKGAPYQSLAAAVAEANAQGALEPIFYCLIGGDYSADVQMPLNSSLVSLDVGVTVTGQITLTQASGVGYRFERITFSPSGGGTGLNADFGGQSFADQPVLSLVDCLFNVSGGGLGADVAACAFEASGLTLFDLDNGTGIRVTTPDAGDQPTELFLPDISCVMRDANDIALTTTDGVGGTDNLSLTIGKLAIESLSEGVGIQVGHTPTGNSFLGMYVSDYQWVCNDPNGGIAVEVSAGAGRLNIGRLWGDSISDTLVEFLAASSGAEVVIDNLSFPASSLGSRTDFRVGNLGGQCTLTINAINVLGGTGILFELDGGVAPAFQALTVGNGIVAGNDVATPVLDFGNQADDFRVDFSQVHFELSGNVGAPKFRFDGSDNAPASIRQVVLNGCTISSNGTDDVISAHNTRVAIEDTSVKQFVGANDVITISVSGGQTSELEWFGHSSFVKTDGAGFAIVADDDPNVSFTESGMLQLICADAQQLNIGTGQQTLNNSEVGPRVVAVGSMASLPAAPFATIDILGDTVGDQGVPGSYPGLHIVSALQVDKTGGAGTNDPNYNVQNEDTGITRSTVAVADAGNGVRGSSQVGFVGGAALLLGPGQRLSLQQANDGTANDDDSTNMTYTIL